MARPTPGFIMETIGADIVSVFKHELRDEGITHRCGQEYALRFEGGWRGDRDAYEGFFIAVCEECNVHHGNNTGYFVSKMSLPGTALLRTASTPFSSALSAALGQTWNTLREELRHAAGTLYPERGAEVAEELTLWLARNGPMDAPTLAQWCNQRDVRAGDVQKFAVKMGLAYMPAAGPIDLNYIFYGQEDLDNLVLSLPDDHPLAVSA